MTGKVWENWKKQDGKASFNLLRLPFVQMRAAHPLGYKFSGVELGVFRGINAERILKEMEIAHLYLVDCWGHFDNEPQTRERHQVEKNTAFWDEVFSEVQNRFSNAENVSIIKAWSEEAAEAVPSGLDFVYVDADHSYDATMKDLHLWLPKLRMGGWLMGDDFMWDGAHQAINEFVAEYNYILHSGSRNTQWWLIKDHHMDEQVIR